MGLIKSSVCWGLVIATRLTQVYGDNPACDATAYGRPKPNDCLDLFSKVTVDQDTKTRWFDVEVMRPEDDGSWPGLDQMVMASPTVQLPKQYVKGKAVWMLLRSRRRERTRKWPGLYQNSLGDFLHNCTLTPSVH